MNREQRREWRRDIKRRKRQTKGTDNMLAKEKWQVKTIAVLEEVFEERKRQVEKHGHAMRDLPDGTGPDALWTGLFSHHGMELDATDIQEIFRQGYEEAESDGTLTRMHLVREELAEAFELDGDDPNFRTEILQVAALCVQWAEYKTVEELRRYRGYSIKPSGKTGFWVGQGEEKHIQYTRTTAEARAIIDGWHDAP